ncbi:MAG: family ATPase [Candidatus Peribacteria bacterium]|nr:family ATPase [Candidatus Peribacteria bacterium]
MPFLREISLRPDVPPEDAYWKHIPALRNIHLPFPSAVTFIVGENGSGKSTLLEAMATSIGFHPSGGSRNNVYDFQPTESDFSRAIRLVWSTKINKGFFLRAESYFNFASHIDELQKEDTRSLEPYGGISLHQQSHGESFLALFKNRLLKGIFLFDEPEAALSPKRQLAFLSLLHEREQSGQCQFIIATHSPILLSYPGATIYHFSEKGLRQVAYKDTDHYQITKDFLDAPEVFYKHLFESPTH